MRLDSYAIRLSLLPLSPHVPPGPGALPLSGRHGVAPGVEGEGSKSDSAPEHLGEESRRETSLETSVEGLLMAGLVVVSAPLDQSVMFARVEESVNSVPAMEA